MGTVYLALAQGPHGFNKLKVVKQLPKDLAEDGEFLTLFLEEARLAARLNHPNIVQTNEVGFDGRNHFIEMEYLEGVTLDAFQRRAARFDAYPLEIGLYILSQALAGLHYAHELTDHDGAPLSIVHRDVSPQNVFVTFEGAVKVLDFGIAKAADSSVHTRTGDLRGKLTYMAPEQAARGLVDRRADVFAVGVLLWQLLTGKRLYEGLGDDEILFKLRAPEIPAPRSIRPDIPAPLDALCARALAQRPEDRPATAEAMQVALEEYLTSDGRAVGPRQLAARMTTLFGERRAATRAEIDAQIRASSEDHRASAAVPLLGQAPSIRATVTDPAQRPPPPDAAPTRVLPSQRPAPTRRNTLGLVGLAGLVIVLGAAVVARHPTAPRVAASPPSKGCTTNVECARAAGRPALCNGEGRCVAFETEDCHVSAEPGNVDDDETLWFGVVMPQRGAAAAAFGTLATNSIDVARRDFMASTGGLPSRRMGRRPRPVGLVVCDDGALDRAARHLIEDVHVPAIIGFGAPTQLVTLAPSLFAHDVLGVETYSSNAHITSVTAPGDRPRLLWRTTGSAANEGKPLAAVVERLVEARVRAGEARVALVRFGNAASLSVAESFVSALRVNGKSIASEPASFRQLVYRSGEEQATVDQLLAFRPTAIVAINTGFAEAIAAPLESKWREGARPLYVFDGTMGDEAFRFLGRDPERRRRYFAVDFPANTETNVKFALRYNEFFSPKITPGTAPGVAYDALFVLVYAAATAAEGEPITGSTLSRGIARLVPPGTPIDVGSAATYRAFGALHAGKNIDLEGAGTPLDFDVASGETQADYAVYCAHVDLKGVVDDAMESGLRYRSTTGAFAGELRCP